MPGHTALGVRPTTATTRMVIHKTATNMSNERAKQENERWLLTKEELGLLIWMHKPRRKITALGSKPAWIRELLYVQNYCHTTRKQFY